MSDPYGDPDTTRYLDTLPPPRPGPGPYRCGCNPAFSQSCEGCDGTDAEERDAWIESRRSARNRSSA